MMIVPTLCFSQTTSKITITSEQLKTANLIFLEHKKFSEEIPLLNAEIDNWRHINQKWLHTDSIYRYELGARNQVIKNQTKTINNLERSYKRRKVITYGTSGTCLILLLCLILK